MNKNDDDTPRVDLAHVGSLVDAQRILDGLPESARAALTRITSGEGPRVTWVKFSTEFLRLQAVTDPRWLLTRVTDGIPSASSVDGEVVVDEDSVVVPVAHQGARNEVATPTVGKIPVGSDNQPLVDYVTAEVTRRLQSPASHAVQLEGASGQTVLHEVVVAMLDALRDIKAK